VSGPFVVLDDDPTGVQTLAGVRVLLAWDARRVRAALDGRPAVHLVTNSRALEPAPAQRLVGEAARTAMAAAPRARLVLRGDSTLRGHLLEEYLAVRDVVSPDRWPVLLLVPALPSAGRVTVDGVHLLEREGTRVPVSETDFARDGVFAYSRARLLDWAEERSEGVFVAARGLELQLGRLRSGGAPVVRDALLGLSEAGSPAVLAADAETNGDLELLAAGYRLAVDAGANVVVRCAPAVAGALAGATATTATALPAPGAGVLLVCGSYVAQTTRQLQQLLASHPGLLAEADVEALAGPAPEAELERLTTAVSEILDTGGLAILATPRDRPPGTTTLEAGERIARGLAHVTAQATPRPSVVVAKGGVTSAVVLREGIGADEADVLGPVLPGVSRWAAAWGDGTPVDYLVVPGNVGADDLLVRLVDALMGGSASC
jgi:uncharacterized protein YgbK (DUF1537 family)